MAAQDSSKRGRLVIFAECGLRIGTGHVMRCLALAQAWRRVGGTVVFLTGPDLGGISDRIKSEGFDLDALPERHDFAGPIASWPDCDVAILDGYGFGKTEQEILNQAGLPVVFLDDFVHAEHYSSEWVLNQNSYAQPSMYANSDVGTKLLLGLRYALLRDEFQQWIGWKRNIPDRATNILITMGGSDAGNASSRVLKSLASIGLENLDVVVVVGGGNPHWDALQRTISQSGKRVRVVQNSADMPGLMAWADIAIAAAGGTSYELCYMGVPSILLVAAENQRKVADSLMSDSVAITAGRSQDFDPKELARKVVPLMESSCERTKMSERGRNLVDGMGAERVRAAIVGRDLRLRPLKETDRELLFNWTNDSGARAASFHPAPVPWEEHCRWFSQRLDDTKSVVQIGENSAGTPVGVVRFELLNQKATISVNVAPEFRGQGWGGELITFSTRSLARAHSVNRIDALVRPENQPSLHLFEKSGFHQIGTEEIAGLAAIRFVWECKVREIDAS